MNNLPRISEAEWRVMRVLWEKAPRTSSEIVQALHGRAKWTDRTIKTLLNRLVEKGAVGYTPQGRVYLYSPAVSEDACVRAETASFVDRVYGGAFTPFLAHFLEREDLSAEDLAALRAILDAKEDES